MSMSTIKPVRSAVGKKRSGMMTAPSNPMIRTNSSYETSAPVLRSRDGLGMRHETALGQCHLDHVRPDLAVLDAVLPDLDGIEHRVARAPEVLGAIHREIRASEKVLDLGAVLGEQDDSEAR